MPKYCPSPSVSGPIKVRCAVPVSMLYSFELMPLPDMAPYRVCPYTELAPRHKAMIPIPIRCLIACDLFRLACWDGPHPGRTCRNHQPPALYTALWPVLPVVRRPMQIG